MQLEHPSLVHVSGFQFPTKGGINIKVCHSGIPKVGDEHPFTSYFLCLPGYQGFDPWPI